MRLDEKCFKKEEIISSAAQYRVVQYSFVQYSFVQYSFVQYITTHEESVQFKLPGISKLRQTEKGLKTVGAENNYERITDRGLKTAGKNHWEKLSVTPSHYKITVQLRVKDHWDVQDELWAQAAKLKNRLIRANNGNGQDKINTLKIINWNLGPRQWRNKVEDISHMVLEYKPDVIVISEANLQFTEDIHLINIKDYDITTTLDYELIGMSRLVVLTRKISISE